jgi:signal transduction histidine kinase
MTTEAELQARILHLEVERRRVLEEAQREADAMFAQYQLSQLLASGDELEKLGAAVLAEIVRASGASAAVLWLAAPGETLLRRVAMVPSAPDDAAPLTFGSVDAVAAWVAAHHGSGVPLEESRALGTGSVGRASIGYLAVRPTEGGSLDAGHTRYLGLVRRELALAFRAAQLRSELARERGILAAILDGASDAIVAVGPDRRISRLNRAAARLVGGTARDGVGATCWAFFGCGPGDDDTVVPRGARACGPTCPFGEVLAHGRSLVRELEVRPAGGAPIPVAASYAAMAGDAAAGPVGVVGVLRDLRAGRELDELKSSFVAAVSHELRTPLALISGHSQSLLHLGLDEATSRHHLVRIGDAVERLGALVDEIIDVSRLESDQLVLERAPTDLANLLDDFAEEAQELPGGPRVRVEAGALRLVDIDAHRIRQVLANLLANTRKYAGPDASIVVRARQVGASSVVVSFIDDGAGIAPDDQPRVFDRFHRGRSVRESAVPGSGLGLYICRRLIETHGGWIRLDPTRRGTSISFRLPAAPG